MKKITETSLKKVLATFNFRVGLCAIGALGLTACTSNNYTVTDNVSLYPVNDSAQQWGVINFYSQYQSNQNNKLPNRIQITLPNGQSLSGQITYLDNSVTTETTGGNSFFDKIQIGIGVGHHIGRHGSLGFGFSSPTSQTVRSDKQTVQINAYGTDISMNCEGEFNRRQRTGTVKCLFTNGVQYSGTIRRVITPAVTHAQSVAQAAN